MLGLVIGNKEIAMKVYEVQVKVANGAGTMIVKTRVMADNTFQAKLLVEQQYGKNNLIGSPRQVS